MTYEIPQPEENHNNILGEHMLETLCIYVDHTHVNCSFSPLKGA